MTNFWTKLKKPIYALAPMAGITDSAFRQMCKSFGADVAYSEMASATALVYNSQKTLGMLVADKKEQPYVIQLFGSNPEHFAIAAKLITKKIKPDGVDINFGCPVKKVAKQGAGAVLMNNPKLAKQIVRAVIDNTDLPVSIKIRSAIGERPGRPIVLGDRVAQVTAVDFLKKMSDLPIAAVMIHGRALKQGHAGEVDWQMIRQARQSFGGILLANGGVKDFATAQDLLLKTGADGVGIGQGALGKPWIFDNIKNKKEKIKNKEEIFEIAIRHARLVEKLKGREGIIEMRKHLCWYVTGLPNASELRRKLVRAESLNEIKRILI